MSATVRFQPKASPETRALRTPVFGAPRHTTEDAEMQSGFPSTIVTSPVDEISKKY
jgi:hypothetical protein